VNKVAIQKNGSARFKRCHFRRQRGGKFREEEREPKTTKNGVIRKEREKEPTQGGMMSKWRKLLQRNILVIHTLGSEKRKSYSGGVKSCFFCGNPDR